MGKKIVWCGNSYYGSPFKVGCNYYSELLAEEGNSVLFIAPPISPFHNKNENEQRFIQAEYGVHKVLNNYYLLTPYTYLMPAGNLSSLFFWIINVWHYFTSPQLIREIEKYEFNKVDVLVIDNYKFLPLIKTIKANKVIVRVTDNLEGFGIGSAAIEAEEKLIKLADKVVYTSSKLYDFVNKLNKNNQYVPNGVDFDKFQGKFDKPDFFESIDKPVAVYVGAIESWFDFEILDYISSKLKDICFLVIGLVKYIPTNFESISNRENVTFYGKIDNSLVPNYLEYSDIGIIPFRRDMELVHAISPLKLYEYMASGLPVVSTKWDELEHIDSPAYLAETKEEFKSFIEDSLVNSYNSKYKKFAEDNDWKQKLKKIII